MADPIEVRRSAVSTLSGKEVAIWGVRPEGSSDQAPVVIISPGFGTGMAKYAMFARTLSANGIACYRFDSTDHVGISEGDVEDFTLTSLAESSAAATDFVLGLGGGPTSLLAFSLAFRAACRVAGDAPGLTNLIGVVGVVNVAATITAIIGEDHFASPIDSLPSHIDIEGQRVKGPEFLADCRSGGWLGVGATIDDLSAIPVSTGIANLCAGADDWVSRDEVEHVFANARRSDLAVYELPHAQHDLSRSPLAAASILETIVSSIVLPGEAVVTPSLDELRAQVVYERSLKVVS